MDSQRRLVQQYPILDSSGRGRARFNRIRCTVFGPVSNFANRSRETSFHTNPPDVRHPGLQNLKEPMHDYHVFVYVDLLYRSPNFFLGFDLLIYSHRWHECWIFQWDKNSLFTSNDTICFEPLIIWHRWHLIILPYSIHSVASLCLSQPCTFPSFC